MEADLDRTPLNDASKTALIETMNARYPEALKICAKHYSNVTNAASVRILELLENSFRLRCWDAQDRCEDHVVEYQSRSGTVDAKSAGDVRRILVGMARAASEATGDELLLPCGAAIGCHESRTIAGAYFLNDLVDFTTLECLNQHDAHPVTDAVSGSFEEGDSVSSSALQSDPDVDHQLLIKIGFRQPVKLKAITIRGCADDESAPQTVKIFQSQPSLGFQEAEDQEAVQALELSPNQVHTGEAIELRFVKFQNVTSLQLFVESNFGADVTRIDHLAFWGTPAEAVDMKAWKPTQSSSANPINPIWEPTERNDPSGA